MKFKRFPTIIILTIALVCAAAVSIYGLPEVEEVVSGEAEVKYVDSNTMQINATDNTIINYNSFNIQENESVLVSLPSSNSQILNRVMGGSASHLMGDLNCNGIFILVNKSGIYVGPNANIDVASLVLSTRDITNSDFLDGNHLFKKLSDDEVDMLLLNEGTIKIQEGGFGVLIAGAVENKGKIIAPAGKIVLAGGDAIKLDISSKGLISVAILEETASTILDHEGKPITEQIKNTGNLEANGGAVILKAESVTDVFRKAINLDGYVAANRIEEKDGVIRIVADGDVEISAEVEAGGEIDVFSDGNIKTSSNIKNNDGDIVLYADHDGDGEGSFTQEEGVIEATGEGDVFIDGSGEMKLGEIKTELGAIKIGTERAPSSIVGEPHYIHAEGDFEITEIEESENITNIITKRGDVLKYNTFGKVTLEAEKGRVLQTVPVELPGNCLEFIANEIYIQSKADIIHIYDNDSNIYLTNLISLKDNFVSLEGEGTGRFAYYADKDVILETNHDIDTAPGVIIPGNQVKLVAQRFGTSEQPVGVSANTTYINRIQGDIVISEIWGLGSTIFVRGPDPDPDSWGAIIYNSNTDLILEASQGGLYVSENSALQAKNLSLIAYEDIEIRGSVIAETVSLRAKGDVTSLGVLKAGTLYEEGATFLVGGEYIVGQAYVQNADNAVTLTTGNYSGETSDTGDIKVKNKNTITLVGNTIFRADSDQDGVGWFDMGVNSDLVGGGY
ncbi:MAG: filamentous hemagglutinin N-terminal domain-containing protein, partial [Candidatus Omnitrophota bacterium]